MTALLLALSLLLAPAYPASAASRLYAGVQDNTTSFSGIDGYIRQSGMNMVDCNGNFLASWIDIGWDRWVQIGQTQGTLLNNCSPSDVRIYAEQNDCNGAKYALWDLGKPPTPNYPVYVNRTGNTTIDPCT